MPAAAFCVSILNGSIKLSVSTGNDKMIPTYYSAVLGTGVAPGVVDLAMWLFFYFDPCIILSLLAIILVMIMEHGMNFI